MNIKDIIKQPVGRRLGFAAGQEQKEPSDQGAERPSEGKFLIFALLLDI